jgi:hypothetical protein
MVSLYLGYIGYIGGLEAPFTTSDVVDYANGNGCPVSDVLTLQWFVNNVGHLNMFYRSSLNVRQRKEIDEQRAKSDRERNSGSKRRGKSRGRGR